MFTCYFEDNSKSDFLIYDKKSFNLKINLKIGKKTFSLEKLFKFNIQ